MTVGIPFTQSHEQLAKEWDAERSGRELGKLSATSTVQGWWHSPCGHTWSASVRFRAEGGTCKVCRGTQVHTGFNDLATTHPELAAQWSSSNQVGAHEVGAGDTRTYLWECEHGHTWKTSVVNRVKQSSRCGVCSKHVLVRGVNDLETSHPDVAAWVDDPHISPSQVTSGSPKKIRWRCAEGHHFYRIIHKQVAKRTCTVCSGHTVLSGVNDLATQFPSVAKEWHPTRNGSRSPATEFVSGSAPAWWKCRTCGHEWCAALYDRTRRGNGCPRCSGREVTPGVNDLATRRPDLVSEWDYARNTASPEDVSEFSHMEVWWVCSTNPSHKWKSSPSNRSSRGCRKCFKSSQTSRGEEEVYTFVGKVCASTGRCTAQRHVSNVIAPYELDIFVPELNLAVEYNGLYWHSEATSSDRLRHKRKVDMCTSAGIRLIQVWEDDWRDKRAIVETALRSALGSDDRERVHGRATRIVDVSPSAAAELLDSAHIQGFKRATWHRGLATASGELVAVLSVTRTRKNYVIERYAASRFVHGGFSKLMADLVSRVKADGGGNVVTFSDNSFFTGSMYEKCGFSMTANVPVDYRYVYKGSRSHKFNFRKKCFKNNPSLIYEDDRTERELANLNGIHRIWDSGKKRWEYQVYAE